MDVLIDNEGWYETQGGQKARITHCDRDVRYDMISYRCLGYILVDGSKQTKKWHYSGATPDNNTDLRIVKKQCA